MYNYSVFSYLWYILGPILKWLTRGQRRWPQISRNTCRPENLSVLAIDYIDLMNWGLTSACFGGWAPRGWCCWGHCQGRRRSQLHQYQSWSSYQQFGMHNWEEFPWKKFNFSPYSRKPARSLPRYCPEPARSLPGACPESYNFEYLLNDGLKKYNYYLWLSRYDSPFGDLPGDPLFCLSPPLRWVATWWGL